MRRLSYRSIAGDLPFHAALISADSRGLEIQRHDHDFAEWMLVIDGEGEHHIRDQIEPLKPGQFWAIGRYDAHAMFSKPYSRLGYINIAFPHDSWSRFQDLSQMPPLPMLTVVEENRFEVEAAFRDSLALFVANPSQLDLIHFFTRVCRLLTTVTPPSTLLPDWLQRALAAMKLEENLVAGFPRLVELCSISSEHLSRTMKSQTGKSPTDWIGNARIEFAKTLLRTTNEDVATIAYRCGFRYDTHFHRTFKLATGQTPRHYRQSNARGVAP